MLSSLSISDTKVLLPFVQRDNFLFALRSGYPEGEEKWNSHQWADVMKSEVFFQASQEQN